MRETIKDAIGNTVQNLMRSGIRTSFSEKELKEFGIVIPKVEINARIFKR